MWKIALGFIAFAALSLFVIMKGGDKLDMGGEQHGAEAAHAPAPTANASAPAAVEAASAPAAAASAAEPAASAAK